MKQAADTEAQQSPQALLRRAMDAALAAVHPRQAMHGALEHLDAQAPRVIGAGKAAAAMAAEVEAVVPGATGLVVTRHGHGCPLASIVCLEAGHPLPDDAGAAAARRLRAIASSAGAEETLLVLLSGGGSALMAEPVDGVSLASLRAVTAALVASGAPIGAINTVRRKLLRTAGGKLAASSAARVVTLAISDVPGDVPHDIASGPTVPDPTTLADARAVLVAAGITPPDDVRRALDDPVNETPKSGDARLARAAFRVVASQRDALDAAASVLARAGYAIEDRGTAITGEAAALAAGDAARALAAVSAGRKLAIIGGGEAEVRGGLGSGRLSGGANRAYALALALALDGHPAITALAADTDGIDGSDDAAGAIVHPGTLGALRAHGIDPARLLASHRSGEAFAAIGDALVTGPTRTNVADLRMILIDPQA